MAAATAELIAHAGYFIAGGIVTIAILLLTGYRLIKLALGGK